MDAKALMDSVDGADGSSENTNELEGRSTMNKPVGMQWSVWHLRLALVADGRGNTDQLAYHKQLARAERIHERTALHLAWDLLPLPLP